MANDPKRVWDSFGGHLAAQRAPILIGSGATTAAVTYVLPSGGPHPAVAFLVLLLPIGLLAAGLFGRADRGAPSEPTAPPTARAPGLWEWGLLALCIAITLQYVWIASGVSSSYSPDAAYYFGVARHIATTGTFEEPIVWQFLAPPDTLVHLPFDYWGGLTSLALVPVLALFGESHAAAATAVALVSGLGLVAFWYLVCFAIPIRSAAAQLIALLAFALSPAVEYYRFDTESVPFVLLLLILALIALARRRLHTATLLAFLLFLTRGDGLIACAFVWLGIAASVALEVPPRGTRRLLRVLSLMAGLVGAYVLYHLAVFGTPTPPASRVAPFLDELSQLLVFGDPPEPSLGGLFGLFSWDQLRGAAGATARTLLYARLVPVPALWLGLGLLACVRGVRQREPALLTVLALCSLGAYLIPLSSLSAHRFELAAGAPSRGLMTLIPAFVLLGGVGLDELLARLRRRPSAGTTQPLAAVGVGIAFIGICATDMRIYDWQRLDSDHSHYAELERRAQGEAVLTDRPHWVVANTRSPAVAIPINGERAIALVIERYRPSWLLLSSPPWPPPFWENARGEPLVRSIYRGTRDVVGPHKLRFEADLRGQRLYRIERLPSDGRTLKPTRAR